MRHTDLMAFKKRDKSNKQVRYITPFNCREWEMRQAMQKHWDILLHDEALKEYLSTSFKWARNLKDMLVKSHHAGIGPERGPWDPSGGINPVAHVHQR